MTDTYTVVSKDGGTSIDVWKSVQPGGLTHYHITGQGGNEQALKDLFHAQIAEIERNETVMHWRVNGELSSLEDAETGHKHFSVEAKFTTAPNDMALMHTSDLK